MDPETQTELPELTQNIFRDLCEHWTVGTLVKQAYEAIHLEESISPVELTVGDTKISAWYDEEDEATYIKVTP